MATYATRQNESGKWEIIKKEDTTEKVIDIRESQAVANALVALCNVRQAFNPGWVNPR